MTRESTTCFGKVSGKPLREYHSREEALDGAGFARSRYGSDMEPYCCRRCGLWHLSPAERRTPSTTGSCTDGRGTVKASYPTYDVAARRAEILRRENGVSLRVYDCQCGDWHLTSS